MKRRDPSQHGRRPLMDPDVRWSNVEFGGGPPTGPPPPDMDSSSGGGSGGRPFFADRRRHHVGAANSSHDLLSEFGAFSSMAPSTSPVFGYSQKNFHISDGNLYSVLSPFQARRSSARPSFLRGQSCVTSVNDTTTTSSISSSSSSSSHHHRDECESALSSSFRSSSNRTLNSGSGTSPNGRRSKLKFHHREEAPSERMSQRNNCEPEVGAATWFDREPLFARDTDSLFTKRRKPPQMISSRMGNDEDDDDDDMETYSKERLFRRHNDSWSSDRSDEFSTKSSFRGVADRKERLWPFDDDDIDDIVIDERVPLNLCIADRQRRASLSSQSASSSIRHDIGERIRRKAKMNPLLETTATSRERRRFSLASLFDDFSSVRSKFRPETSAGSRTTFEEDDDIDDDYDDEEEEEDDVLDLSMKSEQRRKSAAQQCPLPPHPAAPEPQAYPQTTDIPIRHDRAATQASSTNADRKPLISEMFQNMQIKDDQDYMQDAVKRYNATRQLLMQTHPEMFGHDWNRVQLSTSKADEDDGAADADLAASRSCYGRPKSWNVPADRSTDARLLSDAASIRAESAEPCLESGAFLAPPPSCNQLPPLIPSASFSLVQQTLYQQQQLYHQQQQQQQQHQQQQQMVIGQSTRRSASAPSIAASAPSSAASSSAGGKSSSSRGTRHHLDLKNKPFGLITEMPKSAKSPRPRKSISVSPSSSQQHVNDISICKFKLIKGANPVLEEKKSFFVPVIRSTVPPINTAEDSCDSTTTTTAAQTLCLRPTPTDFCPSTSSSLFFVPSPPSTTTTSTVSTNVAGSIGDKFRALKFHAGSQEQMGFRMQHGSAAGAGPKGGGNGVDGGGVAAAANKRLRRRSRKTLAREKLEATFREQGFLIKTQQVSSAEGAVYCKFRQLRKFTRYLFKSWKDYLPKDLDDMSRGSAAASVLQMQRQAPPPPPPPHHHPVATSGAGANLQ